MSSEPVLRFIQAGKTWPPPRTPLRQLWTHLRGGAPDGAGHVALEPLSFEVRAGRSLGIVGLNGAGKSTLLQLAAGTLAPTCGEVRRRGRVAALLELGSGLNPEATGRENIDLYAATLGLGGAQVRERLDGIVAFSGLRDALEMPVKTYSSGMQMRLAFAVAASVEPDVLIVDEALSVGDGVFAKRSFDRIMQLRERGTALLLCSHALFHVDLFCERVLWIDRGRVQAFGPAAEVLPRYQEFLDASHRDGADAPAGAGTAAAAAAADAGALPGTLAASRPELVRLVRAEAVLDDATGADLSGHSGRSRLRVVIDLQVSDEEPHPRAAVVLSSESGRIIGSSLSAPGAICARDARGHARIAFELERIPLNRGRYRVGVYLLCHQGRYVYEWVDPFTRLDLSSTGSEQGPWLMGGRWSAETP